MFMEDDGVDPFHVRQQNRRHKLRLIHHHQQQQQQQQQPPLSPTTFQLTQTQTDHHPSSLPTTSTTTPCFHPHPPTPNPEPSRTSINYSSLPSLSINPNSIHHMNNTFTVDQFHYPPRCFNGGDDDDGGAVSVSVIKPHDSTTTTGGHDNQGCLSLSLSSQYYCYNHNQNQLNSQRYAAAASDRFVVPRPPPCNETSRSSFPLGPFTGYASILSRSRFLKPAQQLLDDFGAVDRGIIIMNSPLEGFRDNGTIKDPITTTDGFETHRWESSRLVLLLDEVYKRYKLYCQQMQSVVASFETVAGLGNAAPYISFAFKSMAKHFTSLKNAIVDQIQLTGRTNLGYDGLRKDEIPPLWTAGQGYENHKPVQNLAFPPHPVWRSQRGLPDRAVAVLKKWLFEHFLHPYPSDSEKQILAHQTGLSRNQVSNWFINARVRLWKPMVEEIHMLETRQAQRSPEAVNRNTNQPIHHLQSTPSLPTDTPYQITPTQKSQYIEHKSNRDELSHTTTGLIDQQINSSHSNLSAIHQSSVSRIRTDESNGISLALGLYQNNGIELSMPFPMNIAHHFGLETDSKVYMRNGF